MSENKTKANEISVSDFLAATVPGTKVLQDCDTLIQLMEKVTGHPPKMWGPSIIGFDSYHYKYESGREGNVCLVGFSPRKPSFSLYIGAGSPEFGPLLANLGKHKMAKGCLYIKKLADVDMQVLEEMVRLSAYLTKKKYPG